MMTMSEKMELARKCIEDANSNSRNAAIAAVVEELNKLDDEVFFEVANNVYDFSDEYVEGVHVYEMYELDDILSNWNATDIIAQAGNIDTWHNYFSLTTGGELESADNPRELSEIDVQYIADLAVYGNQDFSCYEVRMALDSVEGNGKRNALRRYLELIDMKEYALLTGPGASETVYAMEELDEVAYKNRWRVSEVFKMTLNSKGFNATHGYFFVRHDDKVIASLSGKDDYFPVDDYIDNCLNGHYVEDEAIMYLLDDDNYDL